MSSLERSQAFFLTGMSAAAGKLGPGAGSKRTAAVASLAPPSPSPSVGSTTSAAAGGNTPRKDRYDTPTAFYQPANTGWGESMISQLSYATRWLREKDSPQTLAAINGFLSIQRDDKTNELFANQMRQSSSIQWIPDPDLSEQTWASGTYCHRAVIPNVRTKDQLLSYLQKKTDASGVTVKDLKDGWPDCEKALDELEAQHKILVVRHKKEGNKTPRFVWLDDPSLWHEVIDTNFRAMWDKTELPNLDNMVQRLNAVGLKAASDDPRLKQAQAMKPAAKKKRTQRKTTKLTNAHMENMFKDFSHMKK